MYEYQYNQFYNDGTGKEVSARDTRLGAIFNSLIEQLRMNKLTYLQNQFNILNLS